MNYNSATITFCVRRINPLRSEDIMGVFSMSRKLSMFLIDRYIGRSIDELIKIYLGGCVVFAGFIIDTGHIN